MSTNTIAMPTPPAGFNAEASNLPVSKDLSLEEPAPPTQEELDAEAALIKEIEKDEDAFKATPKEPFVPVALRDFENDPDGLAESIPANWNIKPTEEDGVVQARNNITNRYYEGHVDGLTDIIKGRG